MKFKTLLLSGVLAGVAIVGVSSQALGAGPGAGKAKFGTWGYDATSMDPSVKPGDDFFKYVNGNWDKRTQIEPDKTSAGVDVQLADQAERDVHQIVEDLAKDPAKAGPGGRRVGDYYAAWMDEKGLEARGTAPLKSLRPPPSSASSPPMPRSPAAPSASPARICSPPPLPACAPSAARPSPPSSRTR